MVAKREAQPSNPALPDKPSCEPNRCYCRQCGYVESCHSDEFWPGRTAPGTHAFEDPHGPHQEDDHD